MTPKHPFVFLGYDENDNGEAGVFLEKNLMTFAGSRTGKGACHIIPTLKRWEFNAVVIDPSGEAAERTAKEREDQFGGTVAVLDPFGQTNVPERFRATFNPLDTVTKSTHLKTIADGLILRSANETQPHFNNSAKDVASGLLAFIMHDPELDDDERSIARLPDLIAALLDTSPIRVTKEDEEYVTTVKDATIAAMKKCDGFGGLARQIGQRLSPDNTEVANVLSTLRTQTEWIDEDMIEALSRTGFTDGRRFDLRDIKEQRMTLYLVLPADKLSDYGRFLRLFVKLLMSAMLQKTKTGQNMGERCLFILDEGYACGRLNEVISMSGQMAKYGLHLWLFWQSIGQILELYGKDGLESLSEDAEAMTIFGVRGQEVLKYASERMGVFKARDLETEFYDLERARESDQFQQTQGLSAMLAKNSSYVPHADTSARLALLHAQLGRPYYAPDEVREEVKKHSGEPVPRRLLLFSADGFNFLRPHTYFNHEPVPNQGMAAGSSEKTPPSDSRKGYQTPALFGVMIFGVLIIILYNLY